LDRPICPGGYKYGGLALQVGRWATDDNLSPEKQPLGKHQAGVEKNGLLETNHGSRKMFWGVLRIGGKHQGRGMNGRRSLSRGKSAVNETLPIFYMSWSDELEMSTKMY
jgi:hypothetical protein